MRSLWPFPKPKLPQLFLDCSSIHRQRQTSRTRIIFGKAAHHMPTNNVTRRRYFGIAYVLSVICSSILLVCLFTGVVISANTYHRSIKSSIVSSSPSSSPPPRDRGWFPDEHGHTCGNSSAEARSLGCSFDQLTFSWLPPACPHYANAEFLAHGPWRLWTDPHHLPDQDPDSPDAAQDIDLFTRVIDNQMDAWTERREHITHCVYLLLSAAQILSDGTPYASRQMEYGHAKHCADAILKSAQHDPEWTEVDTHVPTISYSERC